MILIDQNLFVKMMRKEMNMYSKEVESWNFDGVQLLHISENNHSEENNRIIAENLKHIEPDIILFELPGKESIFDELNTLEPASITPEIMDRFRNSSIKKIRGNFNIIIDSLEFLWQEKHKKVLLQRIDAPIELTSYCVNLPQDWSIYGIVWNYIRDKYMASYISNNVKKLQNKTVVITCHNIHWERIKMILTKNAKDVLNYYFYKFAQEVDVPQLNINEVDEILKENHQLLYEYWLLINDF